LLPKDHANIGQKQCLSEHTEGKKSETMAFMEEERKLHISEKAAQKAANEDDVHMFRFLDHLDKYPPFLSTDDISERFKFINIKTLRNKSAIGAGPRGSFKCLGARLYTTKDFLIWLDEIKIVEETLENRNTRENKTTPRKSRRGRKTKLEQVRERRNIN